MEKKINIIWDFNEKRYRRLAKEHTFWGFGDEPDYVEPNYEYARELIIGELKEVIRSVDQDRIYPYYIITIDEKGWFGVHRTAKEFFGGKYLSVGDCIYQEDGVVKFKSRDGIVSLWEYDIDIGRQVEKNTPHPNCLNDVHKMGKTHMWEGMETGLGAVRNFWHKYIPKSQVLRCLVPFCIKGEH